MIELDDNYIEELWFTDIDKRVFSFKYKVHNWLRKGDDIQRIGKKSRSSRPDLQAPSHHPDHQDRHHRVYQLKREPSKRISD